MSAITVVWVLSGIFLAVIIQQIYVIRIGKYRRVPTEGPLEELATLELVTAAPPPIEHSPLAQPQVVHRDPRDSSDIQQQILIRPLPNYIP